MNTRTDLALELIEGRVREITQGVTEEKFTFGEIEVSRINITDSKAAKSIGKDMGTYITITTPEFYEPFILSEEEAGVIAKEISALLPKEGVILVAGLGNNDITPDAIGPKTVSRILATRHLDMSGFYENDVPEHCIAAFSPGVLGQTGIETSEIVYSVAKQIKASTVIAVDALAAKSTKRLGRTIQISNTGISPGSGVLNSRKELNEKNLGVPVISIGVPTVVDINNVLDEYTEDNAAEKKIPPMMITPREIDRLVASASKTLSMAINMAVYPEISGEELSFLTGQ